MRPQPWLILVMVGAVVGLTFAGVSTYDFVQHLDRQVHNIHCSFVPGLGIERGASGCQVAMMSPYSSVLRTTVWGGIPISLPAMSVFAFLLFYAIDLAITRRQADRRATAFLAVATALPALTSLVMAYISLTRLGTACKLCIGIYIASAACLIGALVLWRRAVRGGPAERPRARAPLSRSADPAWAGGEPEPAPEPRPVTASTSSASSTSSRFLAGAFAAGVVFVVAPVVLYAAAAPDHARFIGTCEGLPHPQDAYGVMVPFAHGGAGATPAIELLDPLCPACRAFEQRLEQSGLGSRIDRRAVLFPLDSTCNWMVTETIHPGACVVSEAVLCAGDRASTVIAWAFETQDRIRAEAAKDPTAAARIVKARFPDLATCIGSPTAKSRLNKSLRWAVSNGVSVLTPQLFVDGVKLCDEDVDLGLEYTLSAMLDRHQRGQLAATPSATPPAAPVAAPPPTPPPPRPAPTAATPRPTSAAPAAPAAVADRPVTAPSDEPAPATTPAAEPTVEPPPSAPAAPAAPAAEPSPSAPSVPSAPSAPSAPESPPAPAPGGAP